MKRDLLVGAALAATVALAPSASASTTARSAISTAAKATLLADALEAAKAEGGDAHPTAIEAVRTTMRRFNKVICGNCMGGPLPGGAIVYVVAMRGLFGCATCSRPPGPAPPPRTVMTLTFSAKGITEIERELSNRYPKLQQLGAPVPLS